MLIDFDTSIIKYPNIERKPGGSSNDLIPNLVETVKGYAAHEEGVYKDIADSRSRLLAARSPEESIQAANQQSSALGRLLAVVENYPHFPSRRHRLDPSVARRHRDVNWQRAHAQRDLESDTDDFRRPCR